MRPRSLVVLIGALAGCPGHPSPGAETSTVAAASIRRPGAQEAVNVSGLHYRSDDSRAYALLERMQVAMPKINWVEEFDAMRARECSDLPRPATQCADILQAYGLIDANRLLAPTRHESVVTFSALQYILGDLQAVIRHDGYLLPRDVAVGTVPSLCIEPSVRRVPHSESAMLSFKVGLFVLVDELVSTIVRFVPLESRPAGRYHIVDSPEATRAALDRELSPDLLARFRDTLLAFYANSLVLRTERLQLDGLHQDLAGAIMLGLERFAVAHEFAHLALGHGTEPLPDQAVVVIVHDPPLRLTRRQAQELEADNVGMTLTMQAANLEHMHIPLIVAGAQLFLTVAGVYEELYQTLANSELPMGDHPSPGMRLSLIRKVLAKNELLPEIPSYDLGRQLVDITDFIWRKVRPEIAAMPKTTVAAMSGDDCD